MSNVQQQRILVEQLRREAAIRRINVSIAVEDIKVCPVTGCWQSRKPGSWPYWGPALCPSWLAGDSQSQTGQSSHGSELFD